jgi:hypothetical protein
MEISDLDSGPLLLYFKKLESYLAELEQLEPIKPSRHVVLSTSTEAAPSTVTILSESLNDTDLHVNSTIFYVEPTSSVNEPESETEYGSGTVVAIGCAVLAVVGVVIAIFVYGRRYCRAKEYSSASTQET